MNTEGECRRRGESLMIGLMRAGWLLTWLSTTPQRLADKTSSQWVSILGRDGGKRCTCEQRVESVMEVLQCCRTKAAATGAVDCKTTVVKTGGRAASLCVAQRVFSSVSM